MAELEDQVAALFEKVTTLGKLVFGTSLEKKPVEPVMDKVAEQAGGEQRCRRGQQPGSKGHGRRDYSGLETVEEIHDVPEDERVCPDCGAPYEPFDEETSEQIDWQVRIVRSVHRRPTYRRTCKCPVRGILVAPVVRKPIPKGMLTAGFLARLLTEKYVLGRPLERVVAALGNDGLDVAQGTLVGGLKALSSLLAPLDGAIRARNAEAGHLHVDETSWSVFEALAGKANNRWWLWSFVAVDTIVFMIDPTRSTKVIAEHLGIDVEAGALPKGRHLLISSDFYTVYQSLAGIDGVDPLWCFAHIRRYFIRTSDAHKELKPWASAWLSCFGALYVTPGARRAGATKRRACSRRGRLRRRALCHRHRPARRDGRRAPASTARKVLARLDHEWEGLARHEEFPELALDNNAAERALRNPVVMRKNCYGSGSRWAATLAARVWSITATAQLAGCNPLSYLTCYLDACARSSGRAPSGKALEAFFAWAATEADLDTWRGPPPDPGP